MVAGQRATSPVSSSAPPGGAAGPVPWLPCASTVRPQIVIVIDRRRIGAGGGRPDLIHPHADMPMSGRIPKANGI
jgi:hypothetical protein